MPPLTADEYAALKADIATHGIRVPVDVDDEGRVLDGHHRQQIAAELGIDCPTRVVPGLDDEQRRDHAFAVNLHRRQLDPLSWAVAFRALAQARGVELGKRGRHNEKTATVADLASEVGVSTRTVRRRLADLYKLAGIEEEHPDLAGKVRAGDIDVRRASRIARDRKAERTRIEHAQRVAGVAGTYRAASWEEFDHWTSPRQWLLHQAERVEPHEPRKHTRRQFSDLSLLLPSASSTPIPDEVSNDPATNAAIDDTNHLIEQVRAESEQQYDALCGRIAEQRRAAAEPLRKAAEDASDEPTILIGRQYVKGESSAFQADIRTLGVTRWRSPHEPAGCDCGDAIPHGCYTEQMARDARRRWSGRT